MPHVTVREGKGGGQAELTGVSVLVADDDSAVRHLFTVVLRRAGATVHQANSWAEVVCFLRSANDAGLHIDLVLCDFLMPHGSLEDAVSAAADLARAPHFILMTGEVTTRVRAELVDMTIRKPFHTDELLSLVDQVLASRRAG